MWRAEKSHDLRRPASGVDAPRKVRDSTTLARFVKKFEAKAIMAFIRTSKIHLNSDLVNSLSISGLFTLRE